MSDLKPYSGPTTLILSFDIGTINSVVSYCLLQQGQIPETRQVTKYPGQEHGRGGAKVPSILYYDDRGDVKAIGSAALAENVIHRAEDDGWTKAEWWKLHQHPLHLGYTHIKDDDIPPLPPGKSVVDVLTDFISHLFQGARTFIEQHHIDLDWSSIEGSIEFAFTYPNGWENDQQQQYIQAIERAGLVPRTGAGRSRIHMIPEGEASLHYCVSSLPDRSANSEPRGVVIIDAGGGIIDLSMYSMKSNPVSCEEIAPAECCLQGSVFVTRRAVAMVKKKLHGSHHTTPEELADIAREFDETTKLTISSTDTVARVKVGEVRYNNSKYGIKRGSLVLSGAEATGLFEDSIQAIITAFERQRRFATTFTTTKITMAFLVGGFAANHWLWTRLRTYFEAQGVELFRLDDDVNKASARGAVISEIDPDHELVTLQFAHDTYAKKRAELAKTAQSDPIASIMELTGLDQVKKQVLRIKGIIDTNNRQGVVNKERLNLVLLGNPGTGKTTVARLYAQFLQSVKAIPGNAFLETTGSKLAADGVPGAQKLVDEAVKAGGGAIFIDEAYQLVSEFNMAGKQVLDFLLAEMENRVGTLVFILAGYNKEMEKFFEHNPGLRSRVPHQLQFADYTDPELLTMLEDLVYKHYSGRMKVEDSINGLFVRIAVKRLGRGRGRHGFGNARALQIMFAKIRERQAERLDKLLKSGKQADDFFLTKEDLIGPDPSKVLPHCKPWAKLQGLIGLESVKDTVRNLFTLLETNYQRELAEKEPMQVSLNRVFIGSPGTGKTTVAKLYGQTLVELGMLTNGEVVVKNPADFIGGHLGQSEQNTKAILDSTRGKVLVIDEAYMLYSKNATDSYRTGVIDTIVAEIQSVPGEDRCVLLLGYKEQMEEMFQNVNPGLARRFSIEDAFVFEDFTEPQLMQILDIKLKDQDLSATDAGKQVAQDLLSRLKNRPNFGNAGEVENVLGQAKVRYQKRMASASSINRMDVVFEPQDFDPNFNRSQNASANLAEMFKDIVGCESVIKKLEGYQRIARVMTQKGRDMRTLIPSNFVFKGPPGTGKTTVARKVGQVYYDMGFLASADVIECSASDLVGQYVGHTGPKTKGVFEKALGKVLFIDEAYRLGEGHFAKEAMDEIVGLMTNERFMNKVVIILAGYEHEINALLGVNPGLSSRFSEEVLFQNMTPEQCLQLLDKELQKQQIVVPELSDKNSDPYLDMEDIIRQLSAVPSWGNGRDVKTLGKRMTQKAFSNVATDDDFSLSAKEALSIMENMLREQLARQHAAQATPPRGGLPMSMFGGAPTPPSISTSSSTASRRRAPPPPPPSYDQSQEAAERIMQEEEPAPMESADTESPTSQSGRRDAGVSDAVWNQLQTDFRRQQEAKKQAEEEARRLEEELKRQEEARKKAAEEARRLEEELKLQEEAKKKAAEEARLLEEARKEAERQRKAELERLAALERARELEREKQKKLELERQMEEARRREAERRAAMEKAAAELRRKQQEEAARRAAMERAAAELRRRQQEEAARRAAMERAAAELRRWQQEEMERQRKEQEAQRRLRNLGVCPVGYQWIRQAGGYRCAGGSHFVTNAQIGFY